jgi:hypothetical protein
VPLGWNEKNLIINVIKIRLIPANIGVFHQDWGFMTGGTSHSIPQSEILQLIT